MTKTSKATPGVSYDVTKGLYKARKNGVHMGYFTTERQAKRATKVTGISVDNSRTTKKFRLRIEGQHVGYFATRTDAVKAALKLTK